MAQDNEYVQKMIAARDREVAYPIERAVWHEKYIADPKSEPFSPFGFRSAP
jgi:hypothetical protein